MKHIVIGGNGAVGRQLAGELIALGEEVLVADIIRSPWPVYRTARFVEVDITDADATRRLKLRDDDVVYNLASAAPANTGGSVWPVNFLGVENILQGMVAAGARQLIHLSTDLVLGPTMAARLDETQPRHPLGQTGASRLAAEVLVELCRDAGLSITVLRARPVVGAGRIGVLASAFRNISSNRPVAMIGSGRRPYQFLSIADCASACIAAWKAGVPNEAFNLGSDRPEPLRDLLRRLIATAGSRSMLVPVPAVLAKGAVGILGRLGGPVLDREHTLVADDGRVLDTGKAKRMLGWEPWFSDFDAVLAAYRGYRGDFARERHRAMAAARQ